MLASTSSARGCRRRRRAAPPPSGCGSVGRSGASTSASSGLTTRARSVSVLDGTICSSADELTGGGQAILHQAVVAELLELLDSDPGGPEDFDDRPGPEGVVLFDRQVAALARDWVVHPHGLRGCDRDRGAEKGSSFNREGPARFSPTGSVEESLGRLSLALDAGNDDRERGEALAGAASMRDLRRRRAFFLLISFSLTGHGRPTRPSAPGPRPPSGPGPGRGPSPGSGTPGG